ncbi:Uma2 family endonuclease [Phormidium sp. CCY1219]|jgi:Uma2 family endonuclease|uniref:Uma2 family endonuclease n=1 Tax=Phormidium sp. CCY1219 TaxID=2886104 RepID=UPI002D1E8C0F|nr:Uma2 family endonuclease [Phormidium sp. CCY1219]MEB3830040.1 Uma2 family endonuclease [Phormidium sp. CCY1219]
MIATNRIPGEQKTVLKPISWQTFTALLQETGEDRGSRWAYDGEQLEIMTPLLEHESYKSNLGNFVLALAEELNRELKSAGSMTLKQEALEKGIEPDNCYYIQSEPVVRGKQKLNLETDPPPDLAIEVDLTHSSINKLGIYAALQVPELWRYNRGVLTFYQLVEGEYVERELSVAFPVVSVRDLARFVEESQTSGEIAALKAFRSWVREKLHERGSS